MENLNERLNDMLESYPGLMDDNIMNLDLEEIIKDDLKKREDFVKFINENTCIRGSTRRKTEKICIRSCNCWKNISNTTQCRIRNFIDWK